MLMPAGLQPLLLFVHLACVVIWVGGMFFAYVCLRPAAVELLEPPPRLRLWRRVFQRFFAWVWAAVILIPASGIAMMAAVGIAQAPAYWRAMMAVGFVMVAIYLFVVLAPYAALARAVDGEDWKAAGAALGRIRQMVGVNLVLGAITIAIATLGRWFG
jgi:uncharacterized membrane protein